MKLLGVPAIPHKSNEKTGPQIAAQSVQLLREWNCEESVVAMVFDTTSSNTGNYELFYFPFNVFKISNNS